jgi:hypothetical protein
MYFWRINEVNINNINSQMADYVKNMSELRRLKKAMPVGGQRELARRLGTFPEKISNAFAGFTKDSDFLTKLVAEARKLITERAAEAVGRT